MSSPVNPASSAPAAQAAQVAGQTAASQASMSTTVSSMADFKSQAPDVYNAMMMGIAMCVCNKMQRDQEELAKIEEEFRREDEEG